MTHARYEMYAIIHKNANFFPPEIQANKARIRCNEEIKITKVESWTMTKFAKGWVSYLWCFSIF